MPSPPLPDALSNDLHFEPPGNPRKSCRLADLSELPWLLDSSRGAISEAVLRKEGQLDAPAQWFVECVRLALRDVVLEPPGSGSDVRDALGIAL